MTTIVEKSNLAKLLATENVNVQYRKAKTASFNPTTRTLIIPIMKEMSNDLHDLLVGHEVGHAHDTPKDGWHDAVHANGNNYKGFLNVVEDARIEKRMKRRYPGLRKSFRNGFDDLMQRDFFGVALRNLNTLPFIDRVNLITKSDYTLDILFNPEETVLLDKVKAIETWDDAVRVTNELWAFSKEEMSKLSDHGGHEGFDDSDSDYDDSDSYGEDDPSEDDQDGESGSGEGKSSGEKNDKSDESAADQKSTESGDGDDGEDDGYRNILNRIKQSAASDFDQYSDEPVCETDNNFRKNEITLIDEKSLDYVYAKLPTPILSKIITPAKRVQELLTEEFSKQNAEYESVSTTLYNDFKRKNERYISLLAKEFEMRKAATKYAKSRLSNTGDVDISKIYKYQIDDNIFRKMMKVPKGKSHGLILLLDKSGSMSQNMASSIEQILILALFCRKVNIPFKVYGFGNAIAVRQIDYPNEMKAWEKQLEKNELSSWNDMYGTFSKNDGELETNVVYLREVINSQMGNASFQKAVKNLCCLMNSYGYGTSAYSQRSFHRPPSESLSNTPLIEALIALKPILEEFRQTNHLDIVNTVIVHDGDADDIQAVHAKGERHSRKWFNARTENVFITDGKNQLKVEFNSKTHSNTLQSVISNWLTLTTGSKLFGFFIVPTSGKVAKIVGSRLVNDELTEIRKIPGAYFQENEAIKKYVRQMRKEKFLVSQLDGYESFFLIPDGSNLEINDDEIVVTGKVNSSNLAKAFMKFNKTRQVNRVLITKFIQGIAK
jgi:hypothetical protein